MRILILGYGKMGKAIEEIAEERGHTIAHKININNTSALKFIRDEEIDVAFEFTEPAAAVDNIRFCLEHGIPVVSGTTGWLGKLDEMKELCTRRQGALFYSSNFSLGVNIFFALNRMLARLLRPYPNYQPRLTEIHHTEKKDAPSGTAITLANDILAMLDVKKRWVNEPSDQADEISIESIREPGVPGTHVVCYRSPIDEIEIRHKAFSRTGFALGAVLAGEWLVGKSGLFGMEDFMKID
jgi:4-hydroxy-tetrahydrodipicolinate reductase